MRLKTARLRATAILPTANENETALEYGMRAHAALTAVFATKRRKKVEDTEVATA